MALITPDEQHAINRVDGYECQHVDAHVEQHAALMAGASLAISDPIKADCRPDYTAVHNSGRRPLSAIKWVVVHSTEGFTAAGAAAWFANPASSGSTHLVLDDNVCYRTLDNDRIPWGARGANYGGFHIEQAGFAKWPAETWTQEHKRTLQRAAYKTAYHCSLFGISPRWVSADGLKLGVQGVTDHDECSKAFGGSHWDPGPGWPRTNFMAMVRWHYNQLQGL